MCRGLHNRIGGGLPNIFRAWREFISGKKNKLDTSEFVLDLYSNLKNLQTDLLAGKYLHGGYKYFKVKDPKNRDIHKASVRDRVVHHLLYSALYPHFDHYFIYDSYSCRNNKGTHCGIRKFADLISSASQRNTKPVWILKCDIKKCFASIDHNILLGLLKRHIDCPRLYQVVQSVISSFSSGKIGKGIPLGNLTSQLFVNIYMHELDNYIKRTLRIKYYIRYSDDFVIVANDKLTLNYYSDLISRFVENNLKLQIYPNKIFIKTLSSGLDFLGWKFFSDHRVTRSSTKKRMLKKIKSSQHQNETILSYLGMLSHGDAYKCRKHISKMLNYPLWKT